MFAVLQIADFALHAVRRLEALAQVEAAGTPLLPRQTDAASDAVPLVLVEGDGKRTPLIIACSAAAAAAGVERGLTTPQALARCPALVVRQRSASAEQEAAATLLSTAFSLSPAVEKTAPGVCTAHVGGLDEAQRTRSVRAAMAMLADAGLPATAGVAATPLLALYAARATTDILFVNDGRQFLAPLPLATAEPSPAQAAILAQWGVRTLGDLAALPKGDVLQRLGSEGLALWERCAGETSRPLHLTAPPRHFAAEFLSEHAMETLEPVMFLLRRLVDRLALDLANAGLAARDLILRLTLEDESVHPHTVRLPQPTHRPEILFRALMTYLEHTRTTSAVVAVALEIEPTRILLRQEGLFDSALRDPHAFSESLARAAALTGPDRVGTPALANTHRPDCFALETPPETLEEPAAPAAAAPRRPDAFGLALRRCRPPRPANVELHGRHPAFLWSHDIRGRIHALLGPWYGSGDWWQQDRTWEREEWDVALENGGLYRIFRTPSGWFIEGEYD